MRSVLTLGLFAVSLTGCGLAQRQEAMNNATRGVDACRAQTWPNAVAKAKCMNEAEMPLRATLRTGQDLFDLRQASRVVLAEKIGRKELTEAEANLEFAKITSQAVAADSQRSLASRSVRAQERAAAPVSCTRFGSTVTCF